MSDSGSRRLQYNSISKEQNRLNKLLSQSFSDKRFGNNERTGSESKHSIQTKSHRATNSSDDDSEENRYVIDGQFSRNQRENSAAMD